MTELTRGGIMDELPVLNRVHLADARAFLASLPDASVDMVFTDPPYGHNNNDGDLIAKREEALGRGKAGPARPIANDRAQEASELARFLFSASARLLRSGGCCCCCGGGGGRDPQFARWSLWMDEVLDFKQMVVWDKGPMGMGWHYRRSYETVLVGQKRGGKCKWYDQTSRVENIIRHIRKVIPQAHEHPTLKPVALAEFFIRLHTQPGEIVLDPFAGSGTTAVAALGLGRQFLGCEIDPEWVNRANERLCGPLLANCPVRQDSRNERR